MTSTYISVSGQSVEADTVTTPTNRDFRPAWRLEGDVVTVDMTRARDIHRDTLRRNRAPRLEALDAQWFRAAETGDSGQQQEIAAAKQALRAVTDAPRIDAATTPDELAALTLDELTMGNLV